MSACSKGFIWGVHSIIRTANNFLVGCPLDLKNCALLEKCPLDFFYKIKGAVLNRYTFSLLSIGEKVYLFKLAHFFSSIQIFFNVQNIFAGQRASLEKRAQFIQFKVFLLATGHRATDRYSAWIPGHCPSNTLGFNQNIIWKLDSF